MGEGFWSWWVAARQSYPAGIGRPTFINPRYSGGGRAYAEAAGHKWAILSAKHGLLLPDTMIDNYSQSMRGLTKPQRAEWKIQVRSQLEPYRHYQIIMLAGMEYSGWRDKGFSVEFPLKGLLSRNREKWLILHTQTLSNPPHGLPLQWNG